jgi:hypothetical protein
MFTLRQVTSFGTLAQSRHGNVSRYESVTLAEQFAESSESGTFLRSPDEA